MSGDEDETAARPSPMLYDGGLAIGPDADAFVSVETGEHPRLDCPDPRYPATRGRYHCPACGTKIRLAGHESAREFGYRVSDSFWRMVGAGLAFPFRRGTGQEEEDGDGRDDLVPVMPGSGTGGDEQPGGGDTRWTVEVLGTRPADDQDTQREDGQ